MLEIIKTSPEISYLMLPMYYVDGLLESQLLNMSYQTNQNFEIIILDPHYNKRFSKIEDITKKVNYNILYAPYYCNTNIPKQCDYSMWNNASLLANTKYICLLQDYRYCHVEMNNLLIQNARDYIKIEWQLCSNGDLQCKKGNSLIEVNQKDVDIMLNNGKFPDNINPELFKSILNNWGHYLFSKKLWLELNGIDEHITSIHHYADLDLNARMTNYFNINNIDKNVLTIRNIMLRVSHSKKTIDNNSKSTNFRTGLSTIEFDNPYKKPCEYCANLYQYGDINYYDYAIKLVGLNIYNLLYSCPLSKSFTETKVKNTAINYKNDFIRVQCNLCYTTSESQFWWIRTDSNRYIASIGIGTKNKNGRNLKKIDNDMKNMSTLQKIELLKNSWTEERYYTNE